MWSRIRWGNVARLAAVLGAVALVFAWPRLGGSLVSVPPGGAVPVVRERVARVPAAAPVVKRPRIRKVRRVVARHRATGKRPRAAAHHSVTKVLPDDHIVTRRPAPVARPVPVAPRPPPSAAAVAAQEFGVGR